MEIKFNTGRYYSPQGQLIKARLIDGMIYFHDLTRHIQGVLKGKFEEVSQDTVMRHYDRGFYDDHKYPEA